MENEGAKVFSEILKTNTTLTEIGLERELLHHEFPEGEKRAFSQDEESAFSEGKKRPRPDESSFNASSKC